MHMHEYWCTYESTGWRVNMKVRYNKRYFLSVYRPSDTEATVPWLLTDFISFHCLLKRGPLAESYILLGETVRGSAGTHVVETDK
jgi:hypothetical protein